MRKTLPALLAVVTAAAIVSAPTAVAGQTVTAPPGDPTATVTLLTGDTVTVGGGRVLNVRPAPGREHILFESYTDERGELNVVPGDAVAPLARGVLDPRLFNLTELVAAGLDDASADRLPLIVDHAGPAPRNAAAQVSRELPAVGATAVSVDRSSAYWPVARTADHVWLDGQVRVALEHSVPQIGAPTAWQAGHTGVGTTIAVLDCGIDATHPDLAGAVVGAQDFTGSGSADDRYGHGTHVASIITGEHARYRGVAPDAAILNAKVLGDDGFGTESMVIAGMEWAVGQGADVVNLSLGGGPSDGTDPVSQAVNRLTAASGTLFVVAAGNAPTYVGLPGTADAALTVGAVDRADELAEFSGRGPRLGDSAIKPDLTGPGVDITAASAANGVIGAPGQSHVALSGTSMATPHVAGAAAVLAGQHPDWTADRLKATLMGSADPTDGLTVFAQGAGRVDLATAGAATTFATPPSLNLGQVRWPYRDTGPIEKILTYTNHSTSPVTLNLAADVTDEDGNPAPADMFTIAPASVTVPAGGHAAATVTADVTANGPAGLLAGTIVATPETGGGAPVRTPVAVDREVESYDVELSAIGHDGTPSDDYRYRFVPVDRIAVYKDFATGPTTVRLPAGDYTYTGFVRDAETGRQAHFAEPTFTVTADTTLVFDAREAVPVEITVDDPSARDTYTQFDFIRRTDTATGFTRASVWAYAGQLPKLTVKPSTRHDDFTFTLETIKARWNGASFDHSPYLYHLLHSDNAVPATPRWHDRRRDLAKVRSEHASSTPGSTGLRDGVVIPLPGTLTEYYTPDVPWAFRTFAEMVGDTTVSQLSSLRPVVFPRGKTTTVRWNTGVFSPSLRAGDGVGDMAWRNMDLLRFQISPVSDQGHGRWGSTDMPGSTRLLRDGEVIGESETGIFAAFEVGPEPAVYTLRTSLDRSAHAGLTTRYDAEWTFAAPGTVPPEDIAYLPLLAVRFAPTLDLHNAAPAGRRFTIPVTVQRNGSPTPGKVSTPTVDISYDDGATWRTAKVTRDRGQWAVTVHHPADARYVSLRTAVDDAAGNSQHQTIIRAYALT